MSYNADQLRIDRAAVHTHADDTNQNNSAFRSGADNVDRQQAHLQNMTEDGAGSAEYAQARGATRHATDDIHANNTKLVNRTTETADEFISRVSNAAARTIRSIGS